MATKINKKMSFSEIINKNPDAVGILLGKGMHCIGCGMSGYETLEEGAMMHGLDPDEIVDEINKANKKKKIIKKKIVKKKKGAKKK